MTPEAVLYARQYDFRLRDLSRPLTWHYPHGGTAKVSSETGVYLHLIERQPRWCEGGFENAAWRVSENSVDHYSYYKRNLD